MKSSAFLGHCKIETRPTVQKLLNSIFVLSLGCWSGNSKADNLPQDSDQSLESLMDTKVEIATPIPTSQRLAPGVVTSYDQAAIKKSGATNLREFLSLMPGFAFAADASQTIGLGIRGLWAHEGKVLVLIDGFEWNEPGYSNFLGGERFPLELIEKIEVIRGPGSVIHGGYAELGVISITTKAKAGASGEMGFTRVGAMTELSGASRTGAGIHHRQSTNDNEGNPSSFGIGAHVTTTTVTTKPYYSLNGEKADLTGAAFNSPSTVISHLQTKNWNFGILYDNFDVIQKGSLGTPAGSTLIQFKSTQASIGRRDEIDGWKLNSNLVFAQQNPWADPDPQSTSSYNFYDKQFRRTEFNIMVRKFSGAHSLAFGGKYRADWGRILSDGGTNSYRFFSATNPTDELYQHTSDIFGEYQYQMDSSTLTTGVRYTSPSRGDSAAVPRFAWAKMFGDQHIKALASWSFRSPAAENISANQNIRPEKTETLEFEYGTPLLKRFFLTANIFNVKINDPIVYTNVAAGPGQPADQYRNFGQTGSRGIEMTLQWWLGPIQVMSAFCLAQPSGLNDFSQYDSGSSAQLLGFATQQATGWASYETGNWLMSVNGVYESARRGWTWNETAATSQIQDFESTWIMGLHVRKSKLFFEHLTGVFAVSNLLNQQRPYLVPYKGESSSLGLTPGPGRELTIGFEYREEI